MVQMHRFWEGRLWIGQRDCCYLLCCFYDEIPSCFNDICLL